MDYDQDLELALLRTYNTGKAIVVDLGQFHSSPSKGRLWKHGWKVRHRVVDGNWVAAWVTLEDE